MDLLSEQIKSEIISQNESKQFKFSFHIQYEIAGDISSFEIRYARDKSKILGVYIVVNEDECITAPNRFVSEINEVINK
jgi:hypothetical protein